MVFYIKLSQAPVRVNVQYLTREGPGLCTSWVIILATRDTDNFLMKIIQRTSEIQKASLKIAFGMGTVDQSSFIAYFILKATKRKLMKYHNYV